MADYRIGPDATIVRFLTCNRHFPESRSRKCDLALASSPSVVPIARMSETEPLFRHLVVNALASARLLLL